MATTLFLTSMPKSPTATFTTALHRGLEAARGGGSVTQTDNTVATLVAGANPQGTGSVAPAALAAGVTLAAAGTVETGATIGASLFWVSDPIKAITIAGAITVNLRASESAAQANYGIGAKVYRIAGNVVNAAFAQGSSVVELGTADAAVSISLTPTSTAFAAGDAVGVLVFYVGIGGSTSGRTAALTYNGTTGAAAGDSFLTFTETFAFQPVRATQQVEWATVNRAAVFCLGEKWARKGRLWIPAADRPHVFA